MLWSYSNSRKKVIHKMASKHNCSVVWTDFNSSPYLTVRWSRRISLHKVWCKVYHLFNIMLKSFRFTEQVISKDLQCGLRGPHQVVTFASDMVYTWLMKTKVNHISYLFQYFSYNTKQCKWMDSYMLVKDILTKIKTDL